MKFGKRLKKQIEESLPEWRSQFLNYKELKRRVNAVVSSPAPSPAAEAEFLTLLNAEVDKFNHFFLEQEEEFIIRQRELQERIQRAPATEAEVARIRREVVDFHGEMVLLLNYSSINYTGLAKILKKYDKRTGGLLRLPVIAGVLEQPFFTTELISKLVKDCEAMMEAVFPAADDDAAQRHKDNLAVAAHDQSIFRNTVAALLTMQEVRSGSSTIGHFSLPPMAPLPENDWLLQSVQQPSPLIPTQ
ncbi:hypothetical protein EJB05_06154 [Eragrostis curvula]|uniref:SPX domain-containing protein n=1 Tax=Eragrostis curvula TaxID=38414 RepID=A0A5J9WE86_9POAL|nr:hypothetical protein EJB05_51804 [Eragrostis curvula]TVU46609.1 hypothetical protein EJB05_06154 [Eragrostis curvula]